MKTIYIGINEFRKNTKKITENAKKNNVKIIVMHYAKPVFEVHPFQDKLQKEIAEARKQIANGEMISHEELVKTLNLYV